MKKLIFFFLKHSHQQIKCLYDLHSQQAKQLKYNAGKYDDDLEALFYVSTPCRPWLDDEEAQAVSKFSFFAKLFSF